ncbi:MAG TPA: hypothetical protein PKM03_06945, partial [Cyclobacteriaceae bacterium]|nr:hypothetical protein [Cyclobacteriaceae bacterium]
LLQANLGHIISWEGKWLLVGILVVTAVLSLPASDFINRIGVYKSFWWSFLINSLTLIGLFGISSGWVTLLLLLIYTISFTLLSISSLPLAIEKANYYEKVFCVGIFFSGVALPDGMVEIIQAMNG